MVVQQLECEPSGKAKKYERAGPQEFVEFNYEEVTIKNIKSACNKHFNERLPPGMVCDILAGERGPSCTKMSHFPNFKVIHIRFVKEYNDSQNPSSENRSFTMHNGYESRFTSKSLEKSVFRSIS